MMETILAEVKTLHEGVAPPSKPTSTTTVTKEGCQTDPFNIQHALLTAVKYAGTQTSTVTPTGNQSQTDSIDVTMELMNRWAEANIRPTKRHPVAVAAEVLCKKYPKDPAALECMRLIQTATKGANRSGSMKEVLVQLDERNVRTLGVNTKVARRERSMIEQTSCRVPQACCCCYSASASLG